MKTSDGRPISGIQVLEAWRQQTVQATSSTEIRTTNASGEVVFPVRTIRVSPLRKGLGATGSILKFWFNFSLGPYGQVIVGIEGKGRGCERLVYSPEVVGPTGIISECVSEEGYTIRQL